MSAWIASLANLAVRYCVDVQPGDVVVISGPPAAHDLSEALFHQALQCGGLPLIRFGRDLYRWPALYFAADGAGRYVNPLGVADGAAVDVSIGIWARESSLPAAATTGDAPSADEEIRKHWEFQQRAAAGDFRWLAVLFPTPLAAAEASLSLSELESLAIAAAFLDDPDPLARWREFRQRLRRTADFLAAGSRFRFTTPRGTDISLDVTGRRWLCGDGTGNMPDGEVFTAPLESSVDGVFYSDFPLRHEGHRIAGVRLEFRVGKLVSATAEEGQPHLEHLIHCDEGASRVGELGIGLNDRVNRGTGISLLDEKMGGTFHLGLGMSYPQTGGTVLSQIHRDFVADLRQRGQIEMDGRVISESGRFLS